MRNARNTFFEKSFLLLLTILCLGAALPQGGLRAQQPSKIHFAPGEQTVQIPPYDPEDKSALIPSYQVFIDGNLAGVIQSHVDVSATGYRTVTYTARPANGARIKMMVGIQPATLQVFHGGLVTLAQFVD